MGEPTGYYDCHGIPIHVGDLIRVKHYTHQRNRRQMWLYFRVARHPSPMADKAVYVVQNWHDLNAARWQCLLRDCGLESAEVIAESGLQRNERGEIVTFNERKRKERERERASE